MLDKILIYIIILLIFVITGRFIAYFTRPIIKDTKPSYTSLTKYLTAVYCQNGKCGTKTENLPPPEIGKITTKISPFPMALIIYKQPFKYLDKYSNSEEENKYINSLNEDIDDSLVNIKDTLRFHNYIYDDAPRSILDLYPIAENLAFSWPPKYGERYKLTAFPYPKSNNIFKAVYDVIADSVDSYTFPAWIIQKRNPYDFNNSIYNNNYFRNYQDIEIVHACYPPPGQRWPLCDDGGYWMYLATGSGVFWNTGKCLVSLNKLSLLYDIYKCSTAERRLVGNLDIYIKNKNKMPYPPVFGLSINDMVDRLKGKGGGKSIMVAIFTIVNSLIKHQYKNLNVVGFKNLTPSDSGKDAWDNFISRIFVIFYLILVTFIQFFVNVRNKTVTEIIGMLLLFFIIICVLIYILFFVIFEDFLRKIGWITLDMALDATNMNLYEFVEECVTGNLKNPVCNSLAMTQIFDLDVEEHTFAMQYDSFILTSQPNKTGTWEVEICDLRNFKGKGKSINLKGGICGGYSGPENSFKEKTGIQALDICKITEKSPQLNSSKDFFLKAGPIELDPSGPPFYKPTRECKCIDGPKRLCTSCSGYLSQKLCITKSKKN